MKNLKYSFHEICAFQYITSEISSVLTPQKNNLYSLSGWIIHDLHKRLSNKVAIGFAGKRLIKLNVKEVLALRQWLQQLPGQMDEYCEAVRTDLILKLAS